jgi:hypothetical protein
MPHFAWRWAIALRQVDRRGRPNAYWLRPQVVTPLTLQVGHGSFRQRSPIPLSRIMR